MIPQNRHPPFYRLVDGIIQLLQPGIDDLFLQKGVT